MDDRILIFSAIAEGRPDADADGTTWHTILTSGIKHPMPNGDTRGPFDISDRMLEQLSVNFRRKVPIDLNHASLRDGPTAEKEAKGWITALRRSGANLEAKIEWTAEGLALIARRAYQYFSAEPMQARDPDSGDSIGWYLRGATLTNHPVDTKLPAIAFSEAGHQSTAGGSTGAREILERSKTVAPKETPVSDNKIKALAESLGIKDEAIGEHITALSAENERLKSEQSTKDKEIKALSTDVKDLRATVENDLKRRENDAIELAMKGGLTNDDEIVKEARERYALSAKTGKSYFADFVKANSTVPTGVAGIDTKDTSAALSDEVAPMDAGDKLWELAEKADKDNPTDAFNAVLADPKNKALASAYLKGVN